MLKLAALALLGSADALTIAPIHARAPACADVRMQFDFFKKQEPKSAPAPEPKKSQPFTSGQGGGLFGAMFSCA